MNFNKILNWVLIIALMFCFILIYGLYNDMTEQPASPQDRIKQTDIVITEETAIINVANLDTTTVKGTGSMLPTFGGEANLLYITPQNEQDIFVGDIIVYTPVTNRSRVHRVVKIANDKDGLYYVAKGDNNLEVDEEKIRFEDIKWIVVAVLY